MAILYLIKEFIIIGCLAVGGGMTVVPFVQNISSATGWITDTQIIDMIAISEITPGPIAVNMATYIGYIVSGIPGAILTTFALILPQILIVFLIYKALAKFKDNENVLMVLRGLRPVTLALTAGGALIIFKSIFLKLNNYFGANTILSILNWKNIFLGAVLVVTMRKFKLHPIVYFIICGAIGAIFKLG